MKKTIKFVKQLHKSKTLLTFLVFAGVILSFLPISIFFTKLKTQSQGDITANLLLQEGIEAVYNIYLSDWSIYPDGTYRLASVQDAVNNLVWSLAEQPPNTTDTIANKYQRLIQIQSVYRNRKSGELGNDLIDSNSKKVITTISWQNKGKPVSITAQLLLTKHE